MTWPRLLLRPTADDPLATLFAAARTDDRKAMHALCALMRPRLRRVAWSVLRDDDEADDVAQDALVRALTRSMLFAGTGSVSGWMSRIALNLARNRLRDARRRHAIEDDHAHDEEMRAARPGAGPDAVARLEERERRARLLAAVDELPSRQRDVVRLRAVAGLSFADVADALSITEANARMHFAAGKRALRSRLGDGDDDADEGGTR